MNITVRSSSIVLSIAQFLVNILLQAYCESKSGYMSGKTPRYQNGGTKQWAAVRMCFLEMSVPPHVEL